MANQMTEPWLIHGECLASMDLLIMGGIKVDAIITDPPYGTTACKWDSVIPFEAMWERLNKLIKPNGAIVLFGSEPFSSALRMSNIKNYKYDWVWEKNNAVGFVNAKLKPMNKHEIISVFSEGKTSNGNKNNMKYYPQGLLPFGKEVRSGNKEGKQNTYWRPSLSSSNEGGRIQEFTNYPTSILKFTKDSNSVHPTQKPVALMSYLIKTYTNEGEAVLDFTAGSFSTGVACVNTNRNFIGIEMDESYFKIGTKRINDAIPYLTIK